MAIQLAEMTKCKNCYCECHCENTLHAPSDELDGGGLCTCSNCDCENKSKLDEEAFNGA